jgi:hypothetical protein
VASTLTDAQLGRLVRALVENAKSYEALRINRYDACTQADEHVLEYEVSHNDRNQESDTLSAALLAAAEAAHIPVPDAGEDVDALLADLRARCATAAFDAQLPPHFRWDEDAMDSFDFGTLQASHAVRAVPLRRPREGE